MQFAFRDNKDFWAGAMLIATGAVAIYMARDYAMGTTLRMGPGYVPTVLGALLILAGLYVGAMGLHRNEKIQGNWSLRALIILPLSFVLFGLLMEYAGFIPALLVLIFGSTTASTESRPIEAMLLSIGLTAFCVALFIYGLGLPYPLLAGW